jgi:hypothetical protein
LPVCGACVACWLSALRSAAVVPAQLASAIMRAGG